MAFVGWELKCRDFVWTPQKLLYWFGVQSNDIQPSFCELLLCCLKMSYCYYLINSVNDILNYWGHFRLDKNASKSKKRDRLFLSQQSISICDYWAQSGMSHPTVQKFLALSCRSLLAYLTIHVYLNSPFCMVSISVP